MCHMTTIRQRYQSELQGRVAAMTTVFAEHEGESVSQRPLLLLPTDFTHEPSSRETANDWVIVFTLLIYGWITFSELWVTTGNYSENTRNGRMGNFLQKVGNLFVLVSSDAITWRSSGVCSTGFSATFHQDIGGTPSDHFGRFKDGSEACCDLWSGDDYTDRETGGLKTICLSLVCLSFPILNLWFSFLFRLHYFSTLFVSLKHQKPKPAFSDD